MEYFEMLEDLLSMNYSIKIESAGASWKLFIVRDDSTHFSIMVDESLEMLIARAHEMYYLKP